MHGGVKTGAVRSFHRIRQKNNVGAYPGTRYCAANIDYRYLVTGIKEMISTLNTHAHKSMLHSDRDYT